MKKLLTFVAAASAFVFSASAVVSLPYSSGSFLDDPSAAVNDDYWSYCDYGVAQSSWAKATNFQYSGMNPLRLGANTYYQTSDAYLISPKFKIVKGNDYTITFFTKSQVALTTDSFSAYLTQTSPITAEGAVDGLTAVDFSNSFTTTYSERTATFTADNSGEGYIVLRFQGQHGTPVFVADIKITETDNGGDGGDEGDGGNDGPEPDHECTATITSLPYGSTLTTDGSNFEAGWRIINVDPASKTWQPSSDSTFPNRLGAKYGYDTNYDADDYLISPAIHLEKGGEYFVMYGYKASYSNEKLEMVASLNEDMSDAIVIDTKGTITNYTTYAPIFKAPATGDYYIAFHAISPRDKLDIYVSDFMVADASKRSPKPVTNLTAAPNPARDLKVTLSWTNPTEDIYGNSIELTKVAVYRDGAEEPIAEIDSPVNSFEDTAATGLTSGYHTYSVVVYAGENASAATNVGPTSWVGPLTPTAVPAEFVINSQNDFDLFSVAYTEASTVMANQHWRYNSNYGSQMSCGYDASEDDYLITPPIAVDEPGIYRVRVKARVESPAQPYKLEGLFGTSTDYNNLTKAADITGLTNSLADYDFTFEATQAGTYYVALHTCFQDGPRGSAQHYYVKSVSVEKSVILPGVATDVTVTAGENKELTATVEWINPTSTNVDGTTLAQGDITSAVIYRDGEQIAEVTDAAQLVPGEKGSYVDANVPDAGVHTYMVEIYNVNGKSDNAAAVVASPWIGGGLSLVNGLTYTGTDFSDWDLHTTASYGGWYPKEAGMEWYAYSTPDDWAVSPRLEFVANKVYKIAVHTYQYEYNSKGVEYGLDVHLGSESAHSLMPKVGEDGLVKVTADASNSAPTENVFYISTLVPEDEAMAIDDSEADGSEENPYLVAPGTLRLALHACATVGSDSPDFYIKEVSLKPVRDASGIADGVVADGVSFNGSSIDFEGFASVSVYNVAGVLVAADSRAYDSFDLSSLPAGVYFVTVVAEAGNTATLKVAK